MPVYTDASASVDDRVSDLLSRMTIQEKAAQLVQGDTMANWINTTTGEFNASGLAWNMKYRASHFYVGYPTTFAIIRTFHPARSRTNRKT